MTIEDVLKKVEFEEKWLLIAGYNAYNADIAFHTIKWAIKQLSTESENVGEMSEKQEPSDDCISRQAVLKILSENRFRYNLAQEGYNEGQVLWSENLYTDTVRTEIEQLPSAEKTTLCAEKTTITDTDMISRTDLLNAIWQKEYGKDYDGVNMLDIPHIDIIEQMPSAEKTNGDLKAEIDKLPRIKVGNSNSPTVKYCIDEVLIYDLLEHYKGEKTDSFIPQEDVADILNTIESALKGTNYEVVGYDNTDGFLKVLIDIIE